MFSSLGLPFGHAESGLFSIRVFRMSHQQITGSVENAEKGADGHRKTDELIWKVFDNRICIYSKVLILKIIFIQGLFKLTLDILEVSVCSKVINGQKFLKEAGKKQGLNVLASRHSFSYFGFANSNGRTEGTEHWAKSFHHVVYI